MEDIELLYNLDCVSHMKGDNQESLRVLIPINVDESIEKHVVMFETHWLYFPNKHLALQRLTTSFRKL